jgi:hypothetical protein
MAFTGNVTCNVFKQGLLKGDFDFDSDTFYLALYTNAATLDANTTEYTTTGEVVASGYTAGGLPLTVTTTPAIGGDVAYISFGNVSWSSSLTARGALIYKAGANGAVCVLDFGSDKTSTNSFTVQMPANTSTSALIRLV